MKAIIVKPLKLQKYELVQFKRKIQYSMVTPRVTLQTRANCNIPTFKVLYTIIFNHVYDDGLFIC